MSTDPEKPDGPESSSAAPEQKAATSVPEQKAIQPIAQPSVPMMPAAMQELMRRTMGVGGPTSQAFGVQVAMGPPPNAFIEKLQPEHITTIIGQTGDDSKREHTRSLTYCIAGIIGFLILCVIFLGFGKAELLAPILSAFVGFAGGFGVGRATKK